MKTTSLKKQTPAWIVLTGMVVFVLGAVLGWYGFPALIRSQVISNLALKEGSERRKIWERVPYPMDFKIYLFNITNPMEVQRGDTPVLQEVGPYCYNEDKEKVNLVEHEDDDTISFNFKDTWYFNPEGSGNLTGDEMITIPHILILGMALTAEREQPESLPFVNAAIPYIFDNPTSIFVTAPARDLLFDGILFNCTSDDFPVKTVCTELRKRAHHFERVSEDIYKFSIFGTKNGTIKERLEVKRGIENIKEVGKVVEFKDEKTQTAWDGEKCNKLRGTDSTIFPPFLTKKDKIESFFPDLCRSADAEYQYATTYKGVRSYKYSADLGDTSTDIDLKCYCATPNTCLKRGVHDITRCTDSIPRSDCIPRDLPTTIATKLSVVDKHETEVSGAPIIVSLPHFYLADEEYLDGVIGLNPTQSKHEIMLLFEPVTATPVEAYKRLQFNIGARPIEGIDLLENITSTLIPILWVQENMELHQEYIDNIMDMFLIISIMGAMKWIMIAVGVILTATGLFFIMRKKNDNTVITGTPIIALKSTGKPLKITAEAF